MPSYTQVFGGTTILPATAAYRAYTFSTNLALVWALEAQAGGNVAADVMDFTATVGGLSVTLPNATLVSVGEGITVSNVGANSIALNGNGGGLVATIAAGTSWVLYLTDNTTASGTWRTFQLGALTSQATAAALAGLGLVAISTTLNAEIPINSRNTNYTAVTGDRATAVVWTGGVGTISLTAPASLGSDWFCYIKNAGTANLSVTPLSGTIDGQASLNVSPNDSFIVLCTGSLFYSLGRNLNAQSFTYTTISAAGSGDLTLTGVQQFRSAYLFTGALTGSRNIIVPTVPHELIVNNQTTGGFTFTVKTAAGTGIVVPAGASRQLYCDGTNVLQADSGNVVLPLAIADGGTGATTAPNARTNLGATAVGGAVFTAATALAGRTALDAASTDDVLIYGACL